MEDLIKSILDIILQLGFWKSITLIILISGIYIVKQNFAKLAEILKVANFISERYRYSKKDLTTHELISDYTRIKDELKRFNSTNEFRTELARDYLGALINVESVLLMKYIESGKWEKCSGDQLKIDLTNLVSEMGLTLLKDATFMKIPTIFIQKMDAELFSSVNQLFDLIGIIHDNPVIEKQEYNGLKIHLFMKSLMTKWNRLQQTMPDIIASINGDFKKQSITYKGLKDI